MTEHVTRLFASQHGVASLAQLDRAGASWTYCRTRLGRGDWVQISPGVVRASAAPISTHGEVLALLLQVGSDAAASHDTAAAIHGCVGYRLDATRVHAIVPMTAHRSAPVLLHHTRAISAHHLTVVDAIPVTTLTRTVVDLARVTSKGRLARVVDSLLAERRTSVPALESTLRELAGPGRAGVVMLRDLLAERGDGYVAPASRLESLFLKIVRDYGLPTPRREVNLGSDTKWNGRVEFVFDYGVIVEIDGRRWHTAMVDNDADRRRDNEFTASGFAPLRFTYLDLVDTPAMVAATVRRSIEAAARRHAS